METLMMMFRSPLKSGQKGWITRKHGRRVTVSLESLELYQQVRQSSLWTLLHLPSAVHGEGGTGPGR